MMRFSLKVFVQLTTHGLQAALQTTITNNYSYDVVAFPKLFCAIKHIRLEELTPCDAVSIKLKNTAGDCFGDLSATY